MESQVELLKFNAWDMPRVPLDIDVSFYDTLMEAGFVWI